MCVSTTDTQTLRNQTERNPNPGRRSSWEGVSWKVWMCVSVSEDSPPPGDTL